MTATATARHTVGRSLDIYDPLSLAIAPPADESAEQRVERERREAEAQRVNDEIDEMLKVERLAAKKKKKPVKVLLLGQSESGKSTTLKNFQLAYARQAWQEERASWRAIVQLNLLRTVNLILRMLESEMSGTSDAHNDSADIQDQGLLMSRSRSPALQQRPRLAFTEHHKLLNLRLAPLRRVQADLQRCLGSATEEHTADPSGLPTVAAPFDLPTGDGARRPPQEFYIRSSTGWKTALDRLKPGPALSADSNASRYGHGRRRGRGRGSEQEVEETTAIIAGCRDDMRALWEDSVVREMLSRHKLRLEDSAGFFLDDVERIATYTYEPSDDDIVRARLRTVGIQEYHFTLERSSEIGQEWLLYDVGGCRSLRQAWVPFFDDVNAILFLAPISCFDEELAEDPRVNRLEDSYLLWKAVCASPLLAKTQLVLFLNKCDLLDRKLRAGIQVRDHVPSFGDKENNLNTVAKYLKQKFRDVSKQYSPEPRAIFTHLTSVIDTKATALTLGAVREGILREHLRGADFI